MSSDELHRITLDREKAIRDQIDDYRDTIFAILGFCSLWFFDAKTRQNRQTVRIFQGRHLSPIPAHVIQQDQEVCIADVCPDLGIVIEGGTGILGEVKKNFPKDSDERKQSVFTQLKSYDQEFVGWPTQDGKLKRHEIVLLVHQTTSRSACDFWRTDVDHKIKFDRTFAIFQFNRSDQRVPYFFFQLVEGNINQVIDGVDQRDGVQVPMEALLGLYSRSQIYDAEPPLPYLLHLIWEHVVVPVASEDPGFGRLRRNQKVEITLTIEEIVGRLHDGFSFSHWHRQYPERQPQVPKREWVERACRFMVETKEAKWAQEGSSLVMYYRKYDDVLAHFIQLQAESEARLVQQPMFDFPIKS